MPGRVGHGFLAWGIEMPQSVLKLLVLSAILALPLATTASAATIYNEAVDGDANDVAPPSVILGLGQNDIFGSVVMSFGGAVPQDFDAFNLVVGPDLQILSMLYSSTAQSVGDSSLQLVFWSLTPGGASSGTFAGMTNPTATVPFFAGLTPLGAGTHALRTVSLGGLVYANEFATADYRITVNVAPVPLPAGLGLMGGALGLLALTRRHRRG